jgi:hypothetical protein
MSRRRNTQDEELRRLERAWRQSDSALDRERYVAALIRSRQHEAAFAVDPMNVEAAREGFRAWFRENLDLDEALRWWFTHAVAVVPRYDEKSRRAALDAIADVMLVAFEALRGRWEGPETLGSVVEREEGERVGGIPAEEIPNTWPSRRSDPEAAADQIVFTRLAAQAEALERASGAPLRDWPRWLELYLDNPQGLWYDPSGPGYIEFTSLDDAAGEPGILVEEGSAGFNLTDLLHSGRGDDQSDPILLLAALEACQFEEARRSRWAESLVAEAASDVHSHRGFDREQAALVISEEEIERLTPQGHARSGSRWEMRDPPAAPLTEKQRDEYLVRAGAYAIKWGVRPRDVHVAWRTWAQEEEDEGLVWVVASEGDTDALLDEVLRERGVVV